jgi:hypothetical protein
MMFFPFRYECKGSGWLDGKPGVGQERPEVTVRKDRSIAGGDIHKKLLKNDFRDSDGELCVEHEMNDR